MNYYAWHVGDLLKDSKEVWAFDPQNPSDYLALELRWYNLLLRFGMRFGWNFDKPAFVDAFHCRRGTCVTYYNDIIFTGDVGSVVWTSACVPFDDIYILRIRSRHTGFVAIDRETHEFRGSFSTSPEFIGRPSGVLSRAVLALTEVDFSDLEVD